jgi:hypothetical protein
MSPLELWCATTHWKNILPPEEIVIPPRAAPINPVAAPLHRSAIKLSSDIQNVTIEHLKHRHAVLDASRFLLHPLVCLQPATRLPHAPTVFLCCATSALGHVSYSVLFDLVPHPQHSVRVDLIIDHWLWPLQKLTKCILLIFFVLISYFWSISAFDISRWHKTRFLLIFMLYWMASTTLFGPNLCIVFSKATSSGFMWLGYPQAN